jgi:hypothetical protein
MKHLRKYNESLDNDFIVDPIRFNNSKGEEKVIYPSVVVDFIKTGWKTRDKIRKEMDNLMCKQGFASLPKFVDKNGDIIGTKEKVGDKEIFSSYMSVIDINKNYPGFKWVFFVTEPFLNKAEEIANKYSVDFYKK